MIGTASAQVVMVNKAGTITPVKVAFRTLDKYEAAGYKAQAEQKVQVQTWSATTSGGGGTTTVPVPVANIFSGIIREESGRVMVLFDKITAGTTIFACNQLLGGGYCTDPIQFQESTPECLGCLWGFEIPIVSGWNRQIVNAYEFKNAQMQVTSIIIDDYNQPSTLVSAYERRIEYPPSLFGPQSETAIVIVGGFDSSYPFILFAENIRLKPEVLMISTGTPRETIMRIPKDMDQYVGNAYSLTLCQFGVCQTVKVKHIRTDNKG